MKDAIRRTLMVHRTRLLAVVLNKQKTQPATLSIYKTLLTNFIFV